MEIIPGIFAATLTEIEQKVALVAPHVQWMQLDVADSSFVPKATPPDAAGLKALVGNYPAISFVAHLLLADPEKFYKPLADAGFKRLIAHVEASDPRRFLEEVKYESVEVGIAIDGPTEIEQVEPYLELVDFVHVMTVEAGGNGLFLPETVEKIKSIHHHFPDLPIEADGAIDEKTIGIVKDAGVSRVVVTDYLFNNPGNIGERIEELRRV